MSKLAEVISDGALIVCVRITLKVFAFALYDKNGSNRLLMLAFLDDEVWINPWSSIPLY